MTDPTKSDPNPPSTNPDAAQTKRPKVIGGFEIVRKLGQGAMGAVFLARQKSMDREVALKILPPKIAENAKFIDRFQREARASAKLNHQNIVQGIDVGKDPKSGLWYFAMELVDGPTLQQVLKKDGAIPEEKALKIVRDIARALECAAAHGIVHRDIKPDNILLAPTGEAKLADLGLAKQASDDASVTQSGMAVGTPHYMAPEQVRGQAEKIDPRTDIYALGCTLFHLVTGQTPFKGETSPVVMTKHLTEPPPRASDINASVSDSCTRLIIKMMQKKRDQRFQTPTELLLQIERAINHEDTGVKRPVTRTSGTRSQVSGRQEAQPVSRKLGLVVTLAVILGAGVFAFLKWGGLTGHTSTAANEHLAPATTLIQKTVTAPAHSTPPLPAPPARSEAKPPVATVVKLSPSPASEVPAAKPAAPPDKIEHEPVKLTEKKPDNEPLVIAAADSEKKPEVVPTAPEKIDKLKPDDTADLEPKKVLAVNTSNSRTWGGFQAEYFEGQTFQTLIKTQSDQAIDFKWPHGVPPGVELKTGLSVRWCGVVEPPDNGDYVFHVASHAGSRLYLDDRIIFDGWSGVGKAGTTLPEALLKGKKYLLTFEVHNSIDDENTVASLKWGHPKDEPEIVHADAPSKAGTNANLEHLDGGWHAFYGKVGNPTPLVKRTESYINWNWGNISPAPGVPAENFWSEWSGLITPPETGQYSFHIDAKDGARLYLNDLLLSDSYFTGIGDHLTPPLRLEKGKSYALKLEHIHRTEGAHCALSWSSEAMAETPIRSLGIGGDPNGVLPPDGFFAEYGHLGGPKTLLSRREIQAGWNWRSGSPDPEITPDKFWARYTGWITPPADGEYTFFMEFDDGLKLWLDEALMFDSGNRGIENAKAELGPIVLKANKHYFLRAEYFENVEDAHLRLQWSSANMTKQLVSGVIPETYHGDSKEVGHLDNLALAEYGNAKSPLIRRLEGRIWHDFYNGTPGPEITGMGMFWGRWSAGLRVPSTGKYTFKIVTEGTAELHLNGTSVVKYPIATNPKVKPSGSTKGMAESVPLPLNKGVIYFLELSFNSGRRDEYPFIHLLWKTPESTDYEEVPPDVFVIPPQGRDVIRKLPK